VEACDRQANFFDIGGSSVKMIKIHSELQRRLGLEVSIVELFAHPTIATLVERLAVLQQSTGPATVPLAGAPRPLGRMFRPMKPKS
jgi:aryl carrier-like protein